MCTNVGEFSLKQRDYLKFVLRLQDVSIGRENSGKPTDDFVFSITTLKWLA
jgi:hypothetical protein